MTFSFHLELSEDQYKTYDEYKFGMPIFPIFLPNVGRQFLQDDATAETVVCSNSKTAINVTDKRGVNNG